MTNREGRGRPTNVLLACSGLEHAHRGFESFARDCFEHLREEPDIELELIKGSGADAEGERSVPTLTRDTRLAKALGRAWGREPFRVEQIAFALSIQREIARRKPDVVYFSEWHTGKVLYVLRRFTRQNHALVLSNGTLAHQGFGHLDLSHEHTAPALEAILANGADPERHILLPVAFDFPPTFRIVSPDDRARIRDRLGLPRDQTIVISVAALNRHHKRLDYLIEEIAQLPEPRPFLLMVGQAESETPGLQALAQKRLGHSGHSFRSVTRGEVDDLFRASDLFVLASLGEGLPRAMIEAMSHGLPCLAHDYDVAHYALGGHGRLGDFTVPGALADLVRSERRAGPDPEAASERHQFVYESFSWDQLRPQYIDMLTTVRRRDDRFA